MTSRTDAPLAFQSPPVSRRSDNERKLQPDSTLSIWATISEHRCAQRRNGGMQEHVAAPATHFMLEPGFPVEIV